MPPITAYFKPVVAVDTAPVTVDSVVCDGVRNPVVFTDLNLDIRLYHAFLNSAALFKHLLAHIGFTDVARRQKAIYGCIPAYTITYRGEQHTTRVRHWDTLPIIRDLAAYLSEHVTHAPIHTASVHYYPSGRAGIKPHRDKEMRAGTIIASVSFGAARVMRFEHARDSTKVVDVLLPAGSLCLLMPPTNDCWLHSIPTDAACTRPRMSVVFRNYTAGRDA